MCCLRCVVVCRLLFVCFLVFVVVTSFVVVVRRWLFFVEVANACGCSLLVVVIAVVCRVLFVV